jgi:hypothetical protein
MADHSLEPSALGLLILARQINAPGPASNYAPRSDPLQYSLHRVSILEYNSTEDGFVLNRARVASEPGATWKFQQGWLGSREWGYIGLWWQ